MTSFVGKVSCACEMEYGRASKGVPQWIYEEGKIDIEDHVEFYYDAVDAELQEPESQPNPGSETSTCLDRACVAFAVVRST